MTTKLKRKQMTLRQLLKQNKIQGISPITLIMRTTILPDSLLKKYLKRQTKKKQTKRGGSN